MKIIKAVVIPGVIACCISCVLSAPFVQILIPVAAEGLLSALGIVTAGAGLLAIQNGPTYKPNFDWPRFGSSDSIPNVPAPPACNWGALKEAVKEVTKGVVVKVIEGQFENNDAVSKDVKTILCLTDTDQINLVENIEKFITSCLGAPSVAVANKEAIQKFKNVVTGSTWACALKNTIPYEDFSNFQQFNKTLNGAKILCDSLCPSE